MESAAKQQSSSWALVSVVCEGITRWSAPRFSFVHISDKSSSNKMMMIKNVILFTMFNMKRGAPTNENNDTNINRRLNLSTYVM